MKFAEDVVIYNEKTGKAKVKPLNYDKNELFEDTPIFGYPPLIYKDKVPPWLKL